jgi:uncharacterized membrane protein
MTMTKSEYFGLLNKDKIQGLADTFFLVVFSLIILDLKLPRDEDLSPSINLPLETLLGKVTPVLLYFLLTLTLLCLLWVIHKQILKFATMEVDKNYFLMTIFYFATVVNMPFAHSVLYTYQNRWESVFIYALYLAFMLPAKIFIQTKTQ